VREREIKFAVGETFVLPDLSGGVDGVAEVRALPDLDLTSEYHDTADLRLARHGVTLRLRTGDADGDAWTLKLPVAGADGSEREEISFLGPLLEPPPLAREMVLAFTRRAPLAKAAVLRTHRRRWAILDAAGDDLAELALDEVSVGDNGTVMTRFRELELESRGPDLNDLSHVAQALQRQGAVLAEPVPKAIRALGPRATAPPDLVMPAMGPTQPGADVVRAALVAGVRRLVTNDPFARLGDAEAVHQMRVGARRLRSDLVTFRRLLDRRWAEALGSEVHWIADLLGAQRDADVLLGSITTKHADLRPGIDQLVSMLEMRRASAREALLGGLRSPRYLDLLDRLIGAAQSPMLSGRAEREAATTLVPILDRAARNFVRAASGLAETSVPDPEYHAVRIEAKKLRYAAEAAAPSLGSRAQEAAAIASSAAEVQDQLGRFQDAVVLIGETERVFAEHPNDAHFALAAGRLLERQYAIKRDTADDATRDVRLLMKRAHRWWQG